MPEETGVPVYEDTYSIGKYVSRFLYSSYAVMLLLSIVILLVGILFGKFREAFISVPVILALLNVLFFDRKTVHIPPLMVFITVWLMILVVIGRLYGNGDTSNFALDSLIGVVLGLVGLIFAYSFLPAVPTVSKERLFRVVFVSFSIALSLFTTLQTAQYFISLALEIPTRTIEATMNLLLSVMFGAAVISILFCIGRSSPRLGRAVTKYLMTSDTILGPDEHEKAEIERAIHGGENEKVEYKSTLRVNLSTGEKDEKIERAVLKTLVAFLNSRGGTLLIGIADDGSVIGVDDWSFENRDKLSLHLTNLMAEHIGNEFLPFITFRLSNYKEKWIMRIVCRKSDSPVFLKEGKQESFIVRSGPSSVELHGMDTLNYVENRFKKRRGKLFKK
ncbi:MAG: ATP-binding protein [Methanomassiliicoccaceae archaeon]|nr:ATP-binding protein [Methanomassiliicoccaceae archaeon]